MNNLQEFFSYVQPIVNGCGGFIKSEGYMTHFPGVIVMMSADETTCAIIHIPMIFDVYMTADISRFLQLKEPKDQLLENLYFTGWNIKGQHLMNYYNLYDGIDNKAPCIYSEPDCFNINGFEDAVSNSSIGNVRVSDGSSYYRIPASKSIVPITKSDTVSLRIYNCVYDGLHHVRTIRYSVFKKKFKLNVDIYSNIIMV